MERTRICGLYGATGGSTAIQQTTPEVVVTDRRPDIVARGLRPELLDELDDPARGAAAST
jgi:hypothetical protein